MVLLVMLFSSIGTNISVYRENLSISAPTDETDSLATMEFRTDTLLDRIN
jgi:hypothetical protein